MVRQYFNAKEKDCSHMDAQVSEHEQVFSSLAMSKKLPFNIFRMYEKDKLLWSIKPTLLLSILEKFIITLCEFSLSEPLSFQMYEIKNIKT